ncbi:NAD-dependent epimerase/dehydratase family protein [Mucilaginibacter jinjuensis]|uniref:NAD-dependent epimerase/dehydratase family protein n=1 Tax=Mucilaginibacter jinjuensis TaxID=1176721 RepID=A0ABY7TGH5_9SPHI|nr:NAD-dependent epimerase/dehydratase family protein [Mucilaginibacter jinjuensis]WCT14257.1 NAD-dependent epimerase/dehydratase family protein [Mucilaginibacter jinjuensis]
MKIDKILIIGANGQVGSALLPKLRSIYGEEQVIASDLALPSKPLSYFEQVDATDKQSLANLVKKHDITQIYHLAAILSAKGEADPIWAWNVNMQSLLNVLGIGREFKLHKIFVPSSIAVFGSNVPADLTPQDVVLNPSTIYGVSKVATENMLNYYAGRYGLDVRSLRYPGIISYQSLPGGGTTDYAVEIFHTAISGRRFNCYLAEHTTLPMIYIDDAIRATIELMEAPIDQVKVRTSYNLSGLSFTPGELFKQLQQYYPDFECDFVPDFRQYIADSWPNSIDDEDAKNDWGWKVEFDLARMTSEMIAHLSDLELLNITN